MTQPSPAIRRNDNQIGAPPCSGFIDRRRAIPGNSKWVDQNAIEIDALQERLDPIATSALCSDYLLPKLVPWLISEHRISESFAINEGNESSPSTGAASSCLPVGSDSLSRVTAIDGEDGPKLALRARN
jgi:hypothetical protein